MRKRQTIKENAHATDGENVTLFADVVEDSRGGGYANYAGSADGADDADGVDSADGADGTGDTKSVVISNNMDIREGRAIGAGSNSADGVDIAETELSSNDADNDEDTYGVTAQHSANGVDGTVSAEDRDRGMWNGPTTQMM